MYASMAKRPFNIRMRFTHAEYLLFDEWYNTTCAKGVNSFAFPRIDSIDKTQEREYRFVAGQAPKYSNPTGSLVECSMQWEEV